MAVTSLDRSTTSVCDTLMTQSLGRPASARASSTLPGAAARRRLPVIADTTTVAMRDRLKRSDETTRAGRR